MEVVVVNGRSHQLDGATGTLIDWLRGPLGLTGAKPGCGEGECGACTVLIDREPALSCQIPVAEVAGHEVITIEGLAAGGRLHAAQQALVEAGASQCGYCTPAMALRIAALIELDAEPDDCAIAAALEPNLCRCGCYRRIREAAHRAAVLHRTGASGESAAANAALRPDADASQMPVETAQAAFASQLLRRPKWPWDLLAAEERDYADVLGPGLIVVWPAGHPADSWVTPGGAWIHVAPAGAVTAFTGKIDVGQDNRTAFRILVAEELAVDVDQVAVLQGDTDVCPYDDGTFGSRSMLDTAEALRQVAAGCRRALEELGDPLRLAEGWRLVVLDEEQTLVEADARRYVGRLGQAASRIDAVTGSRRFGSDLERPEMLHGAVLRPEVLESTLRSVDCSRAEAIPGVVVVREGSFIGVAAEDPATARRAVAAIDAEWDEPPGIGEDLVGYLRNNPLSRERSARSVDEATGDVAAALEASTESMTATYTAAYVAHVPLETRAALAEWGGDRLTVWTGTQMPFGTRGRLATALGVDEGDVRVVVPPTGGAFGGKHASEAPAEAARLARATGRPVRVHWSRAEELRWGTVRPMGVIDVTAGLDENGALVAWDFLDINAGDAGLVPPYRIGSRRLRYQPAQSPLRRGSYRALAATANNFARESMIDELAHLRGEDPLEWRLGRLDDDRLATVLRAAAERFGWAARAAHGPGRTAATVSATRQGTVTGGGLAVGLEKAGRVATCAEVVVYPDNRVAVRRIVTAYECGTVVNPDTVVNQIEGATIMALGGALLEALPVVNGRLAEPSLTRYQLPRFGDLPEIDVVLCDRPDLPSAGAGETPMIALAPAVANALFAATGRRLRDLPLTPGHRLPDLAGD